MMLYGKYNFISRFFILLPIVLSDAFSYDYYFGELRATDRRDGYLCNDLSTLKICNDRCGALLGICYDRECYCVVEYQAKNDKYKMPQKMPQLGSKSGYTLSRKHHIAHFCPNLEVARACIRKCMKVGKPAFCGKDHVCYCGHKYSGNDKNKKNNATAVKNAFYDLYEKYFGPQYTELDPGKGSNMVKESKDIEIGKFGYKRPPSNNKEVTEDIQVVQESEESADNDTHDENRDEDAPEPNDDIEYTPGEENVADEETTPAEVEEETNTSNPDGENPESDENRAADENPVTDDSPTEETPD